MSASVLNGDRTRPIGKLLTTTGATDVYTNTSGAPAAGIVMMINVNHTTSVDVTVEWYDSTNISVGSGATYYAILTASLVSHYPLMLHGLRLAVGDKLRVTASVASKVTVVSILFETFGGKPAP